MDIFQLQKIEERRLIRLPEDAELLVENRVYIIHQIKHPDRWRESGKKIWSVGQYIRFRTVGGPNTYFSDAHFVVDSDFDEIFGIMSLEYWCGKHPMYSDEKLDVILAEV